MCAIMETGLCDGNILLQLTTRDDRYSHVWHGDASGRYNLAGTVRFLGEGCAHAEVRLRGQAACKAAQARRRLHGRWITRLCVGWGRRLFTLRDSTGGYRLPPLEATSTGIDRAPFPACMDGRDERAVLPIWRGVPVRNFPTRMIDPEKQPFPFPYAARSLARIRDAHLPAAWHVAVALWAEKTMHGMSNTSPLSIGSLFGKGSNQPWAMSMSRHSCGYGNPSGSPVRAIRNRLYCLMAAAVASVPLVRVRRSQGGRRRALLFLLGLLLCTGVHAQTASPDLLHSVLNQLSQHPTVRAAFTQERRNPALTQAQTSSGQLLFVTGHGMLWCVQRPYQETLALTGTRTARINTNGQVETVRNERGVSQVSHMLQGMLSGQLEAVTRQFEVSAAGTPAQWTLRFTPKQSRVAHVLRDIQLDGGAFLQRIRITMQDGTRTDIRMHDTRDAGPLSTLEKRALGWP